MIFQLNKRGKILSITQENNSGQNFAALTGYNFVSLVAQGDSARASQFINDIREKSEVTICQIALALEHNSAPRYECIGVPSGEDSICIIAKRNDSGETAASVGADVEAHRQPSAVVGPENKTESNNAQKPVEHKKDSDDALSAQLAFAKEQVRILFGKMPVALLVVNSKSAIETVNPVAENMFGHSREDWRQLHLNKLLDGRENITDENIFARLSEHPGKLMRYDAFRSNGERFPIEISVEFMDTTKSRLLLCAFDISERIKLEQLKQEFVEMVSHDLRTPLSNLVLFLESLSMGFYKKWSEEKLRGNAERNFEEVSRLIRLINKLLEIDKLEGGFDKPEFVRLMLSDSVESAVSAVSATATKKGVTFKTDVPDLMMLADPDQLAQILINLLGNAVKFSPENGRIIVTGVEEPGWVEIRILDQGPGIPTNLLDHIFERFAQVKTEKSKEGSGLGLAICKTLVEAHGGTIGVRSELGNGSEFWVRLPVKSLPDESA
jgi:PAS domain S-box-containing protein